MKLIGFCAAAVTVAITLYSVSAPTPQLPRPAAVARPQVGPAPVRAVILFDLTLSTGSARIAVSLDDFGPLFDRLRVAGGEIGFGLIRDDSDRPLIRCRVPAPPAVPVVAPPSNSNVFVAVNARQRDDAERRAYETKRQAWAAEANRRIAAFSAAIAPFLGAPANAPTTDVTAALARGDLMLAEPSAISGPLSAIILITDGVHNASQPVLPLLRSGAQVIVVNGVGSFGILESLTPTPLRFESSAAALRYVAEDGGSHAR